jgi:uncharacterized protein
MRRILWLAFAGSLLAAPAVEGPKAQLAEALKNHDTQSFQQLLKAKADANATEADGTTALHWAAHWDDSAAVEALLKAGAKAHAANRYGKTPLAEALTNANAAMVAKLLAAGADANFASQEGQTPLMLGARSGNPAVVTALLDRGAQINTAEQWRGQTPLMWAAAEGHAPVVALLIQRGAQLDAKSKEFDYRKLRPKVGSVGMNFPRGGFTALLFATRQGHLDAAKALVEGGANLNLADPDGVTPLVMAISNLHYDVAGYLIDKGAAINTVDDRGRTPLYTAVDMHTADVSNRPMAKLADKLTSVDITRMLIAKGADVNAQLKRILAPRAVLDGSDASMGEGVTPFVRAAHTGDVELMKMLLAAGANPRIATKAGVTALMSAAGVGWRDGKTRGTVEEVMEAMKLCMTLGFDVNSVNDRGETALHGAAVRGSKAIIEYLAANGARADLRNKSGYTPLDKAMGKGAAAGEIRAPDEEVVAIFKKLEAAQAIN